jgi:glycine hydroxymethyltransferase
MRVLEMPKPLVETLQGHGFPLVSGGTDNHLLLVNVKAKGLTGKEAEESLIVWGLR